MTTFGWRRTCSRKRIKREVLGSRFGTEHIGYGYDKDALYLGGAGGGRDNYHNFYKCNHAITRTFPAIWQNSVKTRLVLTVSWNEWEQGGGHDHHKSGDPIHQLGLDGATIQNPEYYFHKTQHVVAEYWRTTMRRAFRDLPPGTIQ